MTTILTFWLCAIGTTCAFNPINGDRQELSVGIVQCDEFDALTNLPYFDELLARGLAPRHSCKINTQGQDL